MDNPERRRLGRLPKFADWGEARRQDESLLTEWQVYRMFDARRGAWSTFQFLVRQRLSEQGKEIAAQKWADPRVKYAVYAVGAIVGLAILRKLFK